MRSICVFCGSSTGERSEYAQAARDFGRLLAEQDITVIYGGGNVGLMGVLADSVLAGGGRVIGVIPQHLVDKELAHAGVDLRIVGSMHERKALMAELADAFVALPGGIGTFEEFFEILTWSQLGLHSKPCGLLNVSGYYDPLIAMLEHAAAEGFLRPVHLQLMVQASEPTELLEKLRASHPPVLPKWLEAHET